MIFIPNRITRQSQDISGPTVRRKSAPSTRRTDGGGRARPRVVARSSFKILDVDGQWDNVGPLKGTPCRARVGARTFAAMAVARGAGAGGGAGRAAVLAVVFAAIVRRACRLNEPTPKSRGEAAVRVDDANESDLPLDEAEDGDGGEDEGGGGGGGGVGNGEGGERTGDQVEG